MPLRDAAKYVFGIVLAAALLAWVLRDTDPAELWEQVKAASLPLLLVGGALNIGHNVFRVLRWGVLLRPFGRVRFRAMFVAVIIGYMTSWVVPGRLGELVRPMLVAAREGVALGPAVGSVVVDRVLDLVSVSLLFGVGIWITPLSGAAAEHALLLRSSAVLVTAGGIGVLAVMVAATVAGDRLGGWFARRGRLLRWCGRAALALAAGSGALRSPRAMLLCLVYGLAAWGMIVAGTWACIRASGVEVGPGVVMVILPMLVLGVAVPTPGGAGSYHGAMRAGLTAFGVARSAAVTAGLLAHVMMTVPVILAGVALLWCENVRFGDLLAGAREFRHLGSAPRESMGGVS